MQRMLNFPIQILSNQTKIERTITNIFTPFREHEKFRKKKHRKMWLKRAEKRGNLAFDSQMSGYHLQSLEMKEQHPRAQRRRKQLFNGQNMRQSYFHFRGKKPLRVFMDSGAARERDVRGSYCWTRVKAMTIHD